MPSARVADARRDQHAGFRRRILYAALVCAAFLSLSLLKLEPPPPTGIPRINVKWADEVSSEDRGMLERWYRLAIVQHHEGRAWVYEIHDTSRQNLAALVRDPKVADTHGIDRRRFRVDRGPGVRLATWITLRVPALGRWFGVGFSRLIQLRLLAGAAIATGIGLLLLKGSTRRILLRGMSDVSADALGLFRIAFGGALFLTLVKYDDLPRSPFPGEMHRSYDWFAQWEWVHWLAARPDAAALVLTATLTAIVLFTVGLFTRLAYAATLVGLIVHVLIVLQHKSAHDWGLPLVTLCGLAIAPWGDARSLDEAIRRWRGAPGRRLQRGEAYGFALWLPGLTVSLAFAAAAFAKLDTSGLEWIVGGAVKYHFAEDANQAPSGWGLFVASRNGLAVMMAAAAVLIESTFFLIVFMRNARARAVFGAAGLTLLAGFYTLQGVLWLQWWILFLAFVPWELIARRLASTAPGARVWKDVSLSPAHVGLIMVLVLQQIVASSQRLELEPFLSDYAMYSYTWPSEQAFDAAMQRKFRRYRFRARSGSGSEAEITSQIDGLPKATDTLNDLLDTLRSGAPVPTRLIEAARAVAVAYESEYRQTLGVMRVLLDERAFDWTRGRFYWKAERTELGTLDLAAGRLSPPLTASSP